MFGLLSPLATTCFGSRSRFNNPWTTVQFMPRAVSQSQLGANPYDVNFAFPVASPTSASSSAPSIIIRPVLESEPPYVAEIQAEAFNSDYGSFPFFGQVHFSSGKAVTFSHSDLPSGPFVRRHCSCPWPTSGPLQPPLLVNLKQSCVPYDTPFQTRCSLFFLFVQRRSASAHFKRKSSRTFDRS